MCCKAEVDEEVDEDWKCGDTAEEIPRLMRRKLPGLVPWLNSKSSNEELRVMSLPIGKLTI